MANVKWQMYLLNAFPQFAASGGGRVGGGRLTVVRRLSVLVTARSPFVRCPLSVSGRCGSGREIVRSSDVRLPSSVAAFSRPSGERVIENLERKKETKEQTRVPFIVRNHLEYLNYLEHCRTCRAFRRTYRSFRRRFRRRFRRLFLLLFLLRPIGGVCRRRCRCCCRRRPVSWPP